MTDQPQIPTDFQAAAAVEAAIKDLPKPRQELVLRWVAESLGIVQAPTPAPITMPPVTAPITTPPVTTPPPGQMDIATFVASKQPKTDIQFVTVVAYYHRFIAPEGQRLLTITPQLAQDATRLADWDRLTHPGSTLNNAKNQGYLDSAGPGEFKVNTVGENQSRRGELFCNAFFVDVSHSIRERTARATTSALRLDSTSCSRELWHRGLHTSRRAGGERSTSDLRTRSTGIMGVFSSVLTVKG